MYRVKKDSSRKESDFTVYTFKAYYNDKEIGSVIGEIWSYKDKLTHQDFKNFKLRNKTGTELYIHSLYVAPEFRNKGIGRKLMNSILNYARRINKINSSLLYVDVNTGSAQHLYKNMNYEKIGIFGIAQENIIMRKKYKEG
jgi:ribosomal protein S18 acetylase RimI-like enzyme